MRGPRRVDGAREQTGSPELDRVQRLALELARDLKHCPFLVGKAKRVRFASFVNKTVSHRLGTPASFMVIRFNGDPTTPTFMRITESIDTYQAKLDQNNQLGILTTVDCVLDLWFYPRMNLEVE